MVQTTLDGPAAVGRAWRGATGGGADPRTRGEHDVARILTALQSQLSETIDFRNAADAAMFVHAQIAGSDPECALKDAQQVLNVLQPRFKAGHVAEPQHCLLITTAHTLQLTDIHEALCAGLAAALDAASMQRAASLVADPGAPSCPGRSAIAPESALRVLCYVKDLQKVAKACPSMAGLLQTPAARAVYLPRCGAGVAPLFEALIDMTPGMTWQAAWAAFCNVATGAALPSTLRSLLTLALRGFGQGAPEHLASVTFVLTLLHAACVSAPQPRAGAAVDAAAAELLVAASDAVQSAAREALIHASALLGGARQYFVELARANTSLARAHDLAALALGPAASRAVTQHLGAAKDALWANFGASDRTAGLLRALRLEDLAECPEVARFLSGPFCQFVPCAERGRLSLPRVQPAPPPAARAPPAVTVRCGAGGTVAVPAAVMPLLARLAAAVAVVDGWRCSEGLLPLSAAAAAGPGAGGGPGDGLRAAPLPVSAYALRSVLDYAHAVVTPPIVGGATATAHLQALWLMEMRRDTQVLAEVRACAALLGFDRCVDVLGGDGGGGGGGVATAGGPLVSC